MTATKSQTANQISPFSASRRPLANAIRALSMDAVEAAKSGHPGMPMGMADVATVLFSEFLKFDPADSRWADRDRFVLSAGHGSMLLYSLLHLTGYADMTLEELKRFRQLGSKTAGHPEYGHAAGIETTTGPLGQGLANAVGMALAEEMLRARFGAGVVDHHTYVIAGDGCLMEGISHEAISLAGHLKLGRLVVLFDDNGISIDGPTSLSVSDDQAARFRASGWDVQSVDGHDMDAVRAAIARARTTDAPSLIACKTTIAYGAPTKAGSEAAHGAPLGAEEIKGARANLGWDHPAFEIPNSVRSAWLDIGKRGGAEREAWRKRVAAMAPDERAEFERRVEGRLKDGWENAIAELKKKVSAEKPKLATRQLSGNTIEALLPVVPELLGGSADLTGSNNTKAKVQAPIKRGGLNGGYVYWGVREHGMAAAMNGIALHGGFIPYGGTFLVFTDYCRPAIRLSALMGLRVVYVMTHDSIGLGEDGPTHQPIEHLASLRAMPNLAVLRPADGVETAECWALAIASKDRPSVLALTRQALPTVRTHHTDANLSARGAYELAAATGKARVTLFATGSEVAVALDAKALLEKDGIGTRVVSVPCHELFWAQDGAWQRSVLGDTPARVAVEAGVRQGWEGFIGPSGRFVGMSSFGASAPAGDLYKHFRITPDAVAEAARAQL